jgi:tight adherence protein C
MNGLVVGCLFGAGLLLAVMGWRATRPPRPLIAALQRVPAYAPAPYNAHHPLLVALHPGLELLARLFGGRPAVRRRLQLAGLPDDPEAYLLNQALRAGALAASVLLLGLAGGLSRTGPLLLAVVLAAAAGLLLGDWLLSRAAARRRAAVAEQFPVAAQLLALLISAGAPPSEAVARVGTAVGGPLGEQLTAAAQRTGSGQGFAASMRQFGDACDLPVIERFVHGLLSAIERGSPLSEIVRAQALDAAAESHRHLMTTAGTRDIAMLVPVVFVVLPTVVMVSLLPGAVQLGLFE